MRCANILHAQLWKGRRDVAKKKKKSAMRPSDLTRALILNKKGSTRAIFGDALFFFTLLLYFNLDKLQLSTEDLWPQRVQFLIVI